MRVIAGIARGTQLVAPRARTTRPITDRVKEALFGILGGRVIDARFLDLYAGSGAIGIEALSRGATHVTFVERGREAIAALRTNLERTRFGDLAEVATGDVERFLESDRAAGPWDLAVLDPPFAERAMVAPLERLRAHLAPGATVVLRHHWRVEPPAVEGYRVTRQRRFGETMLTFMEATDP